MKTKLLTSFFMALTLLAVPACDIFKSEKEILLEKVEQAIEKAKQGDAEAQNDLGVMYANGNGVPQNYKEALRWLRLAANQGSADAQFNLGLMHYNGQGVPQSYQEAYKWYSIASTFRSEEVTEKKDKAAEERDKIARKWSPQQLGKAQDEALQLFRKFSRKKKKKK